jgi:hypothetical protein
MNFKAKLPFSFFLLDSAQTFEPVPILSFFRGDSLEFLALGFAISFG